MSWLITGNKSKLNGILSDHRVEIYSSVEQVDELLDVLHRPKFRKYLTDGQLEKFVFNFIRSVSIVNVRMKIHVCRDPDDDFLLALAQTVDAHCLITGDKILLEMEKFGRTQIIGIGDYV